VPKHENTCAKHGDMEINGFAILEPKILHWMITT